MRRTPSKRWLEEALTLFWWHLSLPAWVKTLIQLICQIFSVSTCMLLKIYFQYQVIIPTFRKSCSWQGLSLACLSSAPCLANDGLFLCLQSSVLCLGPHFEKERGALMSLLPLAGRTASRWCLTLKWKQKPTPVILAIQSTQRSDCFTANSSHVMIHWLMIWVFFLLLGWQTLPRLKDGGRGPSQLQLNLNLWEHMSKHIRNKQTNKSCQKNNAAMVPVPLIHAVHDCLVGRLCCIHHSLTLMLGPDV